MGRASDPHRQFRKALHNRAFEDAFLLARGLPVSDAEALTLTVIGGEARHQLYDPMALKWISNLLEDRKVTTLDQLAWLVSQFQDVRKEKPGQAEKALQRFIAPR